jgi:hypothetical protein
MTPLKPEDILCALAEKGLTAEQVAEGIRRVAQAPRRCGADTGSGPCALGKGHRWGCESTSRTKPRRSPTR